MKVKRLQEVINAMQFTQASHNKKLNHIAEVVEELSQGIPTAGRVHTPEGITTVDPHETPWAPKPLGVAFAKEPKGKQKNIKREDDNDPWQNASNSGDEFPDLTPGPLTKWAPKLVDWLLGQSLPEPNC
jgi:hypothetical protein